MDKVFLVLFVHKKNALALGIGSTPISMHNPPAPCYNAGLISGTLTDTLKRGTAWPAEAQVELAAYAAEIQAGLSGLPYVATAAELAGVDCGLADADAGRVVGMEAVDRVFACHRRA